MATTSSIRFVYVNDDDPSNFIKVPLASSSTVAKGDLVALSAWQTNTCAAVGAAQSELFAGVAYNYSTTEGEDIIICTDCVISVYCASAINHAGELLKYSAGGNGTKWQLTLCTNTEDGIAYALESLSAAGNTIALITKHKKNLTTGGNVAATDPTGLWRISTSDA
ncbi:MAG TPA: hypothetical protein ENH14_01570 [candidate division WOR-3 bacterium]|uniref:DUF2190 family protein n=1 Tax=candidate division WOR-3 bacterium TaxID=2052148 RepID=A0A7V0LTY8_UNCW3|nr:hypothetical protein [candidate division WOR-3 bacterium]